MHPTSLLELRSIGCSVEQGQPLFHDVNLTVNEGDIIIIQGRSGSGKSTLLKCIAHLVLHEGQCLYRGSPPQNHGIPIYRTRVLYVPQRPSLLPGSPHDFLSSVCSLNAHKTVVRNKQEASSKTVFQRALDISLAWGLDPDLWEREWSSLSGGEGQRILLAVSIALDTAEVLLLDEPTSALDPETSLMVEKFLKEELSSSQTGLKALIWITHSEEQGKRVGSRFIQLQAGGCSEEDDAPV